MGKAKASAAATSVLNMEAKEAYFDDDFVKALDFLTDAIEAGPSARLFCDRAQVHVKLGNYNDAIADCDNAIHLDSMFWKAYYRKAVSYMELKNYISARDALQRSLDISPGDSRITSLLKECNELIGEEDTTVVAGTSVADVKKRSARKKNTSWKLQMDLPCAAEKSKVFLIYDNRMIQHRPLAEDNENAQRIPKIIAKLEAKGLIRRCEVSTVATPLAREHALAVHSNEYVNFVEALPFRGKCPNRFKKYIRDPSDFVYSRGTPTAVFLAAGAVVEACKKVVMGNYLFAFAIVRPPGHHALPAQASGFCYFNNIAIAARYLQREHKVKKVLIVDFDVHHGDGTQSIFSEDNSVMFCSIHSASIFPLKPSTPSIEISKKGKFVGDGAGKGFNVNVNLVDAINDSDMFAVFDFLFLPLAQQFSPDFVLVSAGFDAAADDPLGDADVNPKCFGQLVHRLKNILHGRLVLALEGGYDFNSLSESCAECVEALLGEEVTADKRSQYKDANASTWKVINKVRARLREFWPIFSEEIVKPPEDLQSDGPALGGGQFCEPADSPVQQLLGPVAVPSAAADSS